MVTLKLSLLLLLLLLTLNFLRYSRVTVTLLSYTRLHLLDIVAVLIYIQGVNNRYKITSFMMPDSILSIINSEPTFISTYIWCCTTGLDFSNNFSVMEDSVCVMVVIYSTQLLLDFLTAINH
jgi:hypothetical protein